MFGAVLVALRSEDKSKSLVYMSVSGGVTGHAPALII